MWLPAPLQALSRRAFPDPGRRAVARKAVIFALIGTIIGYIFGATKK